MERTHADVAEGPAPGRPGRGGAARPGRPGAGAQEADEGGRRRLVLVWLPVLAWAGLIFALSSIPSLGTGLETWDLVLRKLAHAGEYAVLALLLRRAVAAPAAFLLTVAYAVSDEVHQTFVPGRVGHPRDVAIDVVGAAAGIVAWRLWRSR